MNDQTDNMSKIAYMSIYYIPLGQCKATISFAILIGCQETFKLQLVLQQKMLTFQCGFNICHMLGI